MGPFVAELALASNGSPSRVTEFDAGLLTITDGAERPSEWRRTAHRAEGSSNMTHFDAQAGRHRRVHLQALWINHHPVVPARPFHRYHSFQYVLPYPLRFPLQRIPHPGSAPADVQ